MYPHSYALSTPGRAENVLQGFATGLWYPGADTRVWRTKQSRGRPIKIDVPRFQAERTFAWFQKKYRRLVVRWERLAACFAAILAMATIHIWIHRLIVG
jgi:hypothetical protein